MTEPVGRAGADLLPDAAYLPSPNCDDRPAGAVVRLIVVHAISLPPGCFGGDAIERFFTNRLTLDDHPVLREVGDLRVSAHLLVRRDGGVVQFVPFSRRAWHAGISCWRGWERCNDFSIGIELEGCDDRPFEEAQYRRLAPIIGSLRECWPIEQIVGHCDIAPGRKTDPGPHFDWRHIAALATA